MSTGSKGDFKGTGCQKKAKGVLLPVGISEREKCKKQKEDQNIHKYTIQSCGLLAVDALFAKHNILGL